MDTDKAALAARFSRTPSELARGFRGIAFTLALGAGAAAHAEVTARDAWVRGMVPAQTSTGAFMTLTSTVDARLVGVSTPAARMAEIHETMVMGGANHMHEVEAIALPAGKPVSLAPGGHHVMLMGMARAVKPGETVPLVLTIEEKGGKRVSVEVKAEVRPLAAR
jgi:copper(I)-binding protein